jgi:hypothetical protein
MAISNLLTGRVRVLSPKNVTADRYQFLDLSQAEPNLGVPSFSASLLTNPAIVVSDSDGNRGFVRKINLDEISGSFSGSFQGDGSGLTGVKADVTPQIASGSATASISPDFGLQINVDTTILGNLYVSKSIYAEQLVVNIISSSVIYSSGSNIFGDEITDVQQFTGSVEVRDRIGVNQITGSSISASFTGSFFGDGRDLFNLPQATKLASGSVTASVSPDSGFVVISQESGSIFYGNVQVTSGSYFSGSGEQLFNIPKSALSFDALVAPLIASGSVTASTDPELGFIVTSVASGSQFTGSLFVSGNIVIPTGSGYFSGSGKGLFDIPESALSFSPFKIATGSITASVSPEYGFRVQTDRFGATQYGSQFTGSVDVSVSVRAFEFNGSFSG